MNTFFSKNYCHAASEKTGEEAKAYSLLVCALWLGFIVTFSFVSLSPLEGEMSSTSRRQRGYMRVNQLTSLRFALYKIFSPVSACAAGALPFVQRDKRKQKHALCQRAES